MAGLLMQALSRSTMALVLALTLSACSKQDSATDPGAPPPSPASAPAVVTGRVPVLTSGTPAVVILEPRHTNRVPEPIGMPVMDQVARSFIPPILFVRTGHPAEFRNSDDELHNINVRDGVTHQQAFNVAVPTGEQYRHAFKGTGVYDVSCDIHAGMSAQIVATSTPYATLADPEGRFSFPDVVPGPYTLTVYAGVRTIERTVEVTGSRTEVDAIEP